MTVTNKLDLIVTTSLVVQNNVENALAYYNRAWRRERKKFYNINHSSLFVNNLGIYFYSCQYHCYKFLYTRGKCYKTFYGHKLQIFVIS